MKYKQHKITKILKNGETKIYTYDSYFKPTGGKKGRPRSTNGTKKTNKMECQECGAILIVQNMVRHLNTKKHLNAINN